MKKYRNIQTGEVIFATSAVEMDEEVSRKIEMKYNCSIMRIRSLHDFPQTVPSFAIIGEGFISAIIQMSDGFQKIVKKDDMVLLRHDGLIIMNETKFHEKYKVSNKGTGWCES